MALDKKALDNFVGNLHEEESYRPTILHGDCLEKLKQIEKESIHLLITDPPYFIDGLDNNWNKGEKKKSTGAIGGLPVGMKFDVKQGKDLQKFIGDVFNLVYPTLLPGAFIAVFSQPRLSHRMAVGIEDVGFEIRDILAWRYTKRSQFKAFTQDHFVDKMNISVAEKDKMKKALGKRRTPQLRPQFETVILGQKPKKGTFVENWMRYKTGLIDPRASLDGKVPQTIMTVEKPDKEKYNCHLTVKPVFLVEHIINLLSTKEQTVLDPFLGSGTTAIAAMKTGRNSIGIEINESYVKIAEKRIMEVKI